jgi:DNA gyrase/topoisomerase IV subunit B
MSSSQYSVFTIDDHIRKKDMWAGSHKPLPTFIPIFTRSDHAISATLRELNIAPALLKCIDEPIVNAIDQAQRTAIKYRRNTAKRTTEIHITVADDNDSRVTISNNGEGIPIEKQPGTQMMMPEFIFGVPFTGSNLSENKGSSIGGTNGLGIKITNIHSREFNVITHNDAQSYQQQWTNGMRDCSSAIITKNTDKCAGTAVSFLLDFAYFSDASSHNELSADDFKNILFSRAMYVSLYIQCIFGTSVCVFWNGAPIADKSHDIAGALFAGAPLICDSQPNLTIFCAPNTTTKWSSSVINGIVVPDGNHITRVLTLIKDAARKQLARLLKCKEADLASRALSSSKIAILIVWRAQNVHWTSQSKDVARFAPRDIDAMRPRDEFINNIAKSIAEAAAQRILNASSSRAVRGAAIDIPLDKYSAALAAGSAQSAKCNLFLAEGDSALNRLGQGISRTIGYQYYGIMSLGGVIPNVRKESNVITQNDIDKNKVSAKLQTVSRSKKLSGNIFMRMFIAATGLDFNCTYNEPRDIARLKYGHIIACVDQDLDGTGNIFSLILSMFQYYWPALIRAGYLQRLATPIVRAYPITRSTNIVSEFYNEREFHEWITARGGDQVVNRAYKVRYNKGIGSNDTDEINQIFRNLRVQTITYRVDRSADRTCHIYLGPDPATRKQQLSRAPPPIIAQYETECTTAHTMPVSYHLLTEAHSYQMDNLERKLNSALDGANQVSRKIINGILSIFSGPNIHQRRKVADLAGTIAASQQYHHGEASMENSITRRAFIAPGGVQVPLILPQGAFGTRMAGGQDAASARYIHTVINDHITPLIFNDEDYPLLAAQFIDGARAEPRDFMPIIPMILLETINVPGHGWNISVYAREFVDVLANLRALIQSNGAALIAPMRPCVFPCGQFDASMATGKWDDDGTRIICDAREMNTMWHGVIIQRADASGIPETWSIGTYEWLSADTIAITELPLYTWTRPYEKVLASIKSRENSIICAYTCVPDDGIAITVTFSEIGLSRFKSIDDRAIVPDLFDSIICALHLRDRMADNINLRVKDRIQEFASYEDVLQWWFPLRRDFYARRIARNIDHFNARIIYFENVIRYLSTAADHISRDMSDDDASAHLSLRKYKKMNVSAFDHLKYEESVSRAVFDANISFDYILNLRERDKTSNAIARFTANLNKWQQMLAQVIRDSCIAPGYPFIGARIWLRELDEIEREIVEGRRTNWQYDTFGRYHYA